VARCEGNYTDALSFYEKSEALLRELGTPHQLPSVLRNIGRTYLRLGEVDRALTFFSESLALHQAQHETAGMAECLIGFAAVAIQRGYPAAGASLLGAANVNGKRNATSAWPVKRMEYDEYLEQARASLAEAEFQAAQSAGSAMSLELAIDFALNFLIHTDAASVVREKSDDLTGREREVAGLVAQGKSNREIAEALVLSTRTVEKHVANILAKLGLTSRAQIVRWAMEHELT